MSDRVFVAGGTGVLGRRVIPLLVSAGYDVTVNVRDRSAAEAASSTGASTTTVDLFDAAAVTAAVEGHDAVVNLATSIPTGMRAVRPSAWAINDRLRTEAASHLAAAATAAGCGRYVGESITFPYVDAGAAWVDEEVERTYFSGNTSCIDAEQAAQSVTANGGVGVALRFAMFFASDSAHLGTIRSVASRGVSPLPGTADGFTSFVHIDDAASAVVAALDAPTGVYNIAEPDPVTRREHDVELAKAVGRRRLRRVPRFLLRVGGKPLDSLSRSQRISSRAFVEATDWAPTRRVVEHWS